MPATYVFVFSGEGDWKLSATSNDWDFELVELEGNEKVVGHHRIDGSICKVVETNDGQILALTK